MTKIIITIIIIVIVALAIWWWQSQEKPVEGDTTEAISEQLESLDLGDLGSEFQAIDAELNNL